jgi:hypothetical protein
VPLKSAQLPRTLSSLWEAVTKLQRDFQEFRSARVLENATIGGGQGLFVQNGGTGPSVKITPNAEGIGFIMTQQAAMVISTGDPTETVPGIVSAYVGSLGGNPVPGLFLLCPDTDTGVASTVMQGGSPEGDSPVWQAMAGASTLSMAYDALVMDIAGGSSVTLDGSGLYFSGETWQSLTLNNGWTTYGSTFQAPIFMKKVDGMVQMAGMIAPGTTTNGTTVATLPAGYIPVADHNFRVSAGAAGTADVYVRSTGAVQIQNTSGTIQWLSLSQIRFPL